VPPAHAAFPGRSGKIAFDQSYHPAGSGEFGAQMLRVTSLRGGNRELRTCRRKATCSHVNPMFSPGGWRLVFDTSGGFIGGGDLIVGNADGSRRRLIRMPREHGAAEAAWSRQGRRFAFTHWKSIPASPDGMAFMLVAGISVMNADGSSIRSLTTGPLDGQSSWSVRGLIAFERETDEDPQIYMVRPDAPSSGS
jgi:hypothetical protein